MRFSFLPIEIEASLVFLLGVIALISVVKYRNNKKYVLSFSSSGTACILESVRKMLVEKNNMHGGILTVLGAFIVILGLMAVIPLGIDFVERTRDKPELRRIGKICLILFLIIFVPMLMFYLLILLRVI